MRLLFVEDHAIFAQTVVAEFMAEHTVVIAPSIAAALERIAAERFDGILVDFDLPDGKGDELVWQLRYRLFLPTPIVAVSAHDAGNAALLGVGANLVCAKGDFAKIGDVLAHLAPPPHPRSLRAPSPRALTRILAGALPALPPSHHGALEDLLEKLLFSERHAWATFTEGLITHTELRSLLLAHVDTAVERLTGARPDVIAFTLAVTAPFERELFTPGEAPKATG